eukprot:361666-Chlamydomonas_euryale.AAC.4
MHELGHPRHSAHLSCRVGGAIRPSAHAGDPAQVGIVGADEGLQLLVGEAAGFQQHREVRGRRRPGTEWLACACCLGAAVPAVGL